ncbi:MAG: hypothetical protein ACO1OB_12940, partial [Archangium sp.]
MLFQVRDKPGIVAETGARMLGRTDDADLVTEVAQRAYKLVDVDALAVTRQGAMVIERLQLRAKGGRGDRKHGGRRAPARREEVPSL